MLTNWNTVYLPTQRACAIPGMVPMVKTDAVADTKYEVPMYQAPPPPGLTYPPMVISSSMPSYQSPYFPYMSKQQYLFRLPALNGGEFVHLHDITIRLIITANGMKLFMNGKILDNFELPKIAEMFEIFKR